MTNAYFVKIEDMTWPSIGKDIHELAWKQRYSTQTITDNEKLIIASIMDAYCALIQKPSRARAKIISNIKRNLKERGE